MNSDLILKMNLLGGMHQYIIDLGDEDAYDKWFQIMGDEPTEEDLETVANDDDLWKDACLLFGCLVKNYS